MRILITGSSDGLGLLTARLLSPTHQIVLHARNPTRATHASQSCPQAHATVIGDLSTLAGIRAFALEADKHGPYDCIMHNAGLYLGPFRKTEDKMPALVAVNTLAPYMLSCLMAKPKRLIFVSSQLHQGGDAKLKDITWRERGEGEWNAGQAYADSKLHNIMFAFAFARHFGIACHSVDPGWVKTKMGGENAMDDLDAAVETFGMVATGEGAAGRREVGHWYQKREREFRDEARDVETQEKLLKILEGISGVKVPE
ncbi:short chain dehydrogenase [Aureobasidium pullulans]|uniref:Short chain dehydrogenase n=1 Tax=Aureobasidium pullulans TaxID=5580 RepID=A0A4S9U7Q1_AURPU|nr:short chain dehydrogenase [Aureobasidium pullulans]THZ34093.1 short chain dehydrogenase [Aureobasidium pullulans]THZ58986.1 short chain dehydrogenase [Aureobasidium pullulans]THZ86238.1 short chain dehydrogenase [Aureobasidium pullulans]